MSRTVAAFLLGSLLAPVMAFAQDDAKLADLKSTLVVASNTTILNDPKLSTLMTSLAEGAIKDHCASCHGADLHGKKGVPDLLDTDWLWAVTGEETTFMEPILKIMQTIMYGIRDRDCPDDVKNYGACPDTRYSEMPSYKAIGLSEDEINDLTEFVLNISGQKSDEAAVKRAMVKNARTCVECHNSDFRGFKPYGGPDLTDDVWLYGGSREDIHKSIHDGREGYCPPWWNKLDAATMKALGVYLYEKSFGLI